MTRRITLTFVGVVAVMALAAPTALARYVEGVDLQSAPVATQMTDASNRAKLDVPVQSQPERRGLSDFGLAQDPLYGFSVDAITTTMSDALERSVPARIDASVRGDSHDRFNPANTPVSIPSVSSGRDIEWPQLGIGFGVGILLVIGLWLTVRLTHIRPLAH